LRSGRRLAAFFVGGFDAIFLGARAKVLGRGILDNQISITNPGIAKLEDIFTYPQ
jgi:hypothetical protein